MAEVVIVGLIDDDWCYVSMLDAEDWSDLWDTEDETDASVLVEVVLAGLPAFVPRAAIVPRSVGLAALVSTPTFSQVPPTYIYRLPLARDPTAVRADIVQGLSQEARIPPDSRCGQRPQIDGIAESSGDSRFCHRS
ncbi:hypothetical protein [Dactylosporangium sp. CA-139066]|uniref:hypothetical protein n=1 Tax=Dactylosporangium sp. CA-139066 TaxID=3239930 RepID=UPI003D910837